MKKRISALLRSLCLLSMLLSLVRPALAHGAEPRLEISLERINPGGVFDVRGVDFEPEEHVSVALIGDGVELSLREINANEEGTFLEIITLPAELAAGLYLVEARTDDHQITSPALTVFGPAILEEEGEPVRDEDDGLLAPMPTYAPGVVPGGAAQPVTEMQSKEQPASTPRWTVSLLLIITVLAVFVAFWRRTA